MAQNLGFGQTDQLGRVIPRLEQQRPQQPVQPQAQVGPSMYDTVLQVLQDPRNAWIGMGPMAGVVRGAKFLGGLTPREMLKARLAGQAGADTHFMNGPMVKYLDSGGVRPNFGPPAIDTMGAPSKPEDWAKALSDAWQRHDRADEMISPAVNPFLRDQMMRSQNLRPLGFKETQELRRNSVPPEKLN